MLKTILSIAGKPGLYKLISSGKNMLIEEAVVMVQYLGKQWYYGFCRAKCGCH